jgi:hypothetical protein
VLGEKPVPLPPDHKSYFGLIWNRVQVAEVTSWRLTASSVAQRCVQFVGRISEMYDKACTGGQRNVSDGHGTAVQTCSALTKQDNAGSKHGLNASFRINDQFPKQKLTIGASSASVPAFQGSPPGDPPLSCLNMLLSIQCAVVTVVQGQASIFRAKYGRQIHVH